MEAGRLAGLADGAVLITLGETEVLVTAVASSEPKEQFDFLPLTVDVEERMYAAGKIPGGFFRREGRASETAILTARLIDRPLRPSFPKGFRNEVQVIATILSVDHVNPFDVVAITGASMAVMLAGMPFEGPVAGLRLGYKDGRWVPFPTYQEVEECTFDLAVAGGLNSDGDVRIIMVEAEATDNAWFLIKAGHQAPTEEIVAQGLEEAKQWIRELCEFQNEFAKVAAKPAREFPTFPEYGEDLFERVRELTESELGEAVTIGDKAEREMKLDDIKGRPVMTPGPSATRSSLPRYARSRRSWCVGASRPTVSASTAARSTRSAPCPRRSTSSRARTGPDFSSGARHRSCRSRRSA